MRKSMYGLALAVSLLAFLISSGVVWSKPFWTTLKGVDRKTDLDYQPKLFPTGGKAQACRRQYQHHHGGERAALFRRSTIALW
jgi:hypothetical protein